MTVENPVTPAQLREVAMPRSYRFYKEATVTKIAWEDPDVPVVDPEHELFFVDQGGTGESFVAFGFVIVNDGPDPIQFSFDGINLAGDIKKGEAKTDDQRRERRVFLRLAAAGAATKVRVWAW
jgi:hypothetical protein